MGLLLLSICALSVAADPVGWWSFRPPARALLPAVRNRAWVRNTADAFVLAGLEARGLAPASAAEPRTLIRRAYLDVLGLPPAPAEVENFVTDGSPSVWDRLVDHLLDSPSYGERQATSWLDLAGYSDANPNAWRYRDYVVRSFNNDKPYDRFVREQIAGDEIWPDSDDAIVATGFLRLAGPEPASAASRVFLGLPIRSDPLVRREFPGLQAVFARARPADYPLANQEDVARYEAEQRYVADRQKPFRDQLEALERPYRERAASPGALGESMSVADRLRRSELLYEIERWEQQRPLPLPAAMGTGDDPAAPPVPSASVPSIVGGEKVVFADRRRRATFAGWIASPENPLTARVMVNRMWQQHFGEGLVHTPDDFGSTGAPPSNPELLDWLATEFVRQGWSIKAMHRLILTSSVYRSGISRHPLDPAAVRDARLAVAGELDARAGGRPRRDAASKCRSVYLSWPRQPGSLDESVLRRFASRVEFEAGIDRRQQVEHAFRLALARPPSQPELQAAVDAIRKAGLIAFCRELLDSQEFRSIP